MGAVRFLTLVLVGALALGAVACNGGGGSSTGGLKIVSLVLNPSAPTTGSVVQLSATYSGVNSTAGLIKNWTVSAGTLTTSKPDFGLLTRQTAKAASESSASTTASTVYWITPTAATTATVKLVVEGVTKEMSASVAASPVSLSVTSGDGGSKICTVRVTNITDLYQAAFRINFSSAWQPVSATPGDFLGSTDQIVWLGLTNQNGFVPCAISKRGSVPGNDGTGTLATITFTPVAAVSSARGASSVPFDIGLVLLRTSKDEAIAME
jgi:hypothetical protein